MNPVDHREVAERIAALRERLDAAEQQVRLVAVTKRFPADRVEAAAAAGADAVGENYAQELLAKQDELQASLGAEAATLRWHLIGAVQRNKIRKLAGRVAMWETIDRVELLDELHKRDAGGEVLIQVNASGEPQKNGAEPDEVPALLQHGLDLGLDVVGLMSVGVAGDRDATKSSFEITRALVDTNGLAVCSMGMTADLDLALAAGSTMVRVGSGIFGERP